MDTRFPFDPTTVHDPSAWQPLRYVDGNGNPVTQGFVGAQWQQVATFALSPGSLRSADGPARYGSADYRAQAQALLDLSARLTDEQKIIAEHWAAPPFPEYSSGHGSFSAAGAEILRLFTHNDRFGGSVTLPAGSSRIEPAAVPASDLTLSWATFSEAANQAGISRRYGGIHFEQRDLDAALKAATGLQQLLAQPYAAAEGVPRAPRHPASPGVTPGETAPG